MTEEWYSDAALERQRLVREKHGRGEKIELGDMAGIWEPRVPCPPAEQCAHCHGDARAQSGGMLIGAWRWCWLCIARGRHE